MMGTIALLIGLIAAIGLSVMFFKKQYYKKSIGVAFVGALIVGLILEVLVFNYQAFENIGKGLQTSTYEATISGGSAQSNNSNMTVNLRNKEIEVDIENINQKVSNVEILLPEQVASAEVDVNYKDDVFTDFSKTASDAVVVQRNVPKSEIIRLHLAGKTKALKLNIKLKDAVSDSGSIVHDPDQFNLDGVLTVKTNETIPFVFEIVRLLLVMLLFVALSCIIKYRNYNFRGEKSKKVRRTAIIAVLVLQTIFMTFLSVSLLDDNAEYFVRNTEGFDANSLDQYQQLTMALDKGQLYLDHLKEGSYEYDELELSTLKKLEKQGKVYNPNERDSYVGKAHSSYRWDEAYYNGHYYTYYGPVPVVLVFLPVYKLTGIMLSTKFVALLFGILIAILMSRFVYNIANKREKLNLWVVIGTMLVGMNTIFLTSCFEGAKIYELSPMSGLVLVLAGINFLYRATTDDEPKSWYWTVGALCMALSIGCKANYLFASVIAGLFIIYYWYKNGEKIYKDQKGIVAFFKKIFAKPNIKTIIRVAVPYFVVGILLMAYNYARFGSPFDFGVAHQLTLYNTEYYSLSDISKLPAAIYHGLLAMPHTQADFPFITMDSSSAMYQGFLFKMDGVGIMAYPVMWLIVLIPWIARRKMAIRNGEATTAVIDKIIMVSSVLIGFFTCYSDIAMGGLSFRYALDYGWAFFIPVIFVIFGIEEWCREKGVLKTLIKVILVMFAVTLLVNVLLTIGSGFNQMDRKSPVLYYNLFHMIQFWK